MKTEITTKQKAQFNAMLDALKLIGRGYSTPNQLLKESEKDYGLDYTEALEMSYENIQETAKARSKGVKYL